MIPNVEAIFIAPERGEPVIRVRRVRALEGAGLEGDRYCDSNKARDRDHCQVTLIGADGLKETEQSAGVSLSSGEHRRNLVISGIDLEELNGRRFRIGEATMEHTGERPPCGYLESLTEPGMAKALSGKGGICARVVTTGWIREGATIELLAQPSKGEID